jgi:asparagine synthetase B (glutamine-hydrolysing)
MRGLRAALETLGCNFATRSDTKVLIYVVVVRRGGSLRGMYASALWDLQEQEL